MARFPSPARLGRLLGARESALLQYFERLSANRFEEVNNYSDRLTRRIYEAGMTMKVAAGKRAGESLGACRSQHRRGLPGAPGAGTSQHQGCDGQHGATPEGA